jgi:dolichyl-phosphate-mannose--protein O-mannosyl transferase
MAGVFLLAAGLRFWGLNRFNTLVFDEAYYAKYGNNYLTHTFFADAHPPLGKYLIALVQRGRNNSPLKKRFKSLL